MDWFLEQWLSTFTFPCLYKFLSFFYSFFPSLTNGVVFVIIDTVRGLVQNLMIYYIDDGDDTL